MFGGPGCGTGVFDVVIGVGVVVTLNGIVP